MSTAFATVAEIYRYMNAVRKVKHDHMSGNDLNAPHKIIDRVMEIA